MGLRGRRDGLFARWVAAGTRRRALRTPPSIVRNALKGRFGLSADPGQLKRDGLTRDLRGKPRDEVVRTNGTDLLRCTR